MAKGTPIGRWCTILFHFQVRLGFYFSVITTGFCDWVRLPSSAYKLPLVIVYSIERIDRRRSLSSFSEGKARDGGLKGWSEREHF